MRRKLNSEAGLTMVEMLTAMVVLALLALVLGTGLQMATRSNQTVTAQSELDLLLSTAVNALADDLRYARNVSDSPSFTYTSDSYGENTSFSVVGGRIVAKGDLQVLPAGAYGLNGAYTVLDNGPIVKPSIDADGEITFTISLTVTYGDISASTPDGGVTVRCLNHKK